MRKSQIRVGAKYKAKVNGRLVTVRVDAIRECGGYDGSRPLYDVTNLSTGRKTIFRSAAKFRSEVMTGAEMKAAGLTPVIRALYGREPEGEDEFSNPER